MFLPNLKSAVLAASLSVASLAASAQTFGEFLNKPETPLTFMGVDFLNVKYIGDPGVVAPRKMKRLFSDINRLMVQEPEKYNLSKALNHSVVVFNISVAEANNEKIDTTTLLSLDNQRNRLTTEQIAALMTNYSFPANASGVGLVFVVEELVKAEEQTVFWVTFVDMASKKMLYTEKISGKALGMGFRNHWAGGIYNGLKIIKSRYGDWKKKYAKS